MLKKIVVFGGSGFIGGHLVKAAQKNGGKVYGTYNAHRPDLDNITWIPLNLTHKEEISKFIDSVKPDVIVNTAAISNIDYAQQNRELAWEINVEAARHIAEKCAEYGHTIRHIFFSTDAVFDGKSDMYSEEDTPAPVNFYGETKYAAEKAVLKVYPDTAIVRISLVLGFPVTGGNSFLLNLNKKLQEGQEITCPIDEYRTPVDVYTLSKCILELAENDFSGFIHIGSTDSINRHELTKKLALQMGFAEAFISQHLLMKEGPQRVPRHKNGILNVEKAKTVFKTKLLNVSDTIRQALALLIP